MKFMQKILVFFICLNILNAQPNNIDFIKEHIFDAYKKQYEEIKIDKISLIARDNLPSLKIIQLELLSTKSKEGYIKIKYKQDQNLNTENIRYSIKASIAVFIASKNIAQKQNITPDLIKLKYEDLDKVASLLSKSSLPTKKQILNSSAKYYIPENSIIYNNKLSKKIVIYKDDLVTILVKKQGISITSSAIALQNAHIGDKIKVKNTSSNKILEGIVLDSTHVEIPF